MNVVIVEDEIVSSRRLERLLQPYSYNVVARLNSIKQVVSWLKLNNEPDLLFLDIHLADGLCFEIFNHVAISSPIIFTTAYNAYSLKAFDYNSISYLLKPINKDDLAKSIKKANSFITNQNELVALKQIVENENLNTYKSSFAIRVGAVIKLIKTEDIAFVFSQNNCTYFNVSKQEYLVNYTLNILESQLNEKQFFRVNRSFIINKSHITDICDYSNNRFKVNISTNKESLIVSRNKSKAFKKWLNN